MSTRRTTKPHLSDILAMYPQLRYYLTQYRQLAPLITFFTGFLAEDPLYYRVNGEGAIVSVFVGDRTITDTIALSEVLQVGQYVFVGAPFSINLLRVRVE